MTTRTITTTVGDLVVHESGGHDSGVNESGHDSGVHASDGHDSGVHESDVHRDRLPVLVFRHGIFFDHRLWAAQVAAFSGTHRVLSVDSPGHGASRDRGRPYSLEEDAAATLEILDAFEVSSAVLIGHSWGGMTALRTALADPGRVDALALVDTPLVQAPAAGRARYRALRALVRTVGTPAWFARPVAADMFTRDARRADPRLDAHLIAALSGLDSRRVARAMTAVLIDPVDMLDRMSRLTMPVLIAAGAEDYVLPPAVEDRIRLDLPEARVAVLPGAHVIPLESPAETTALLEHFLGSLP
jgi:3-oxoadipate enol-lactonase